jgi:hypothetical protein
MHPLSLLLTDGSKSATNWALLYIAGLASYLRALDDVQFFQKSNAKCLFLLLETLSATSFIKPKSNTTISILSPCILQQRLQQTTNKAQQCKQVYIQKNILKKNCILYTECSQEYQDKTIDNFWQFIFFSNKVYIDPSSTAQGYILQEQGIQYNTENIQERGKKTGVKLYIAV